MALVNVANMAVLDNPAPFTNPLQFEITFECLEGLEDDLEWKVIYVGSANTTTNDQTLDEILVGPVPIGINKFILQTDAPNHANIPSSDVLGVTVLLVTCSYRDKEFLRVGYYVNNEYSEEYDEEKGVPEPLEIGKVVRTILADKPRVTRFPINWGDLTQETEEQRQDSKQQLQQGIVVPQDNQTGTSQMESTVEPADNDTDILMEEDINEEEDDEEEEEDDEEKDSMEEEDISLDDHAMMEEEEDETVVTKAAAAAAAASVNSTQPASGIVTMTTE